MAFRFHDSEIEEERRFALSAMWLKQTTISGRQNEENLMAMTIGETIQELHTALRDYIEATYHVSNPDPRRPTPRVT